MEFSPLRLTFIYFPNFLNEVFYFHIENINNFSKMRNYLTILHYFMRA